MINLRLAVTVTMMGLLTTPANASDPVLLHAAGSALKVLAKFGASGLLRDEISGGAKAEVFASANMEHPQGLAKANKAGPSFCSRATNCARWPGRASP